jgi:hypothetical protein
VPLPETIPVKFTEEDAEYISVRPVKRQTFRLRELVDMVLSVTGRDLPRVQQILRTGTVVYHFYRYKWQSFEADPAELSQLLAEFPADFPMGDPRRLFKPKECTVRCSKARLLDARRLKSSEPPRRKDLCSPRAVFGTASSPFQRHRPNMPATPSRAAGICIA